MNVRVERGPNRKTIKGDEADLAHFRHLMEAMLLNRPAEPPGIDDENGIPRAGRGDSFNCATDNSPEK